MHEDHTKLENRKQSDGNHRMILNFKLKALSRRIIFLERSRKITVVITPHITQLNLILSRNKVNETKKPR